MAFTYRASEKEEEIISSCMEKRGFVEKSKCLSYIVTSFPTLETQNQDLKSEIERLKKENARLTSFLVKEESINTLESFISNLIAIKKDIVQFKNSR